MNQMVPHIRPENPALLGYPPTFPIELAMRVASVREVCEAYGISKPEWDQIRQTPQFVKELQAAHDMLREEGMTFRVKARLQSEALLETSWDMIHDKTGEVPASVRADLLKFTIRAAGLEEKHKGDDDKPHNAFQINIQL